MQIKSEHDISIVTDVKWRSNYLGRKDHPLEEAENVVFDEGLKVQRIGKNLKSDKNSFSGEFIGMMKFKGMGAEIFKNFYHTYTESVVATFLPHLIIFLPHFRHIYAPLKKSSGFILTCACSFSSCNIS